MNQNIEAGIRYCKAYKQYENLLNRACPLDMKQRLHLAEKRYKKAVNELKEKQSSHPYIRLLQVQASLLSICTPLSQDFQFAKVRHDRTVKEFYEKYYR